MGQRVLEPRPPMGYNPPPPGPHRLPDVVPPRPPRKYDYRWKCDYCSAKNDDDTTTCKGCGAWR